MSSFLSGALWLTTAGLFSQLAGFGYRIALSRMVGAEVIGLYQLIMPVYATLMSLTAAGLTVALSTLSARSQALGDSGALLQARRRALILFFCLAVPLGAAAAVFSDPLSVYLLGDARTRLGVMLLVPCVLFTGVENLHKHCFYGVGQFRAPALSEMAEQLIRAGAVLLLVRLALPCSQEQAVGTIVLGMVACEVFSACTLTALFRRRFGGRRCPAPKTPVPFRQLLAIAAPVAATSLLGTALGSLNAVLIPAKLVEGGTSPEAAIASFGVLCGMTMPLISLPTGLVGALCLMLSPSLSRKSALGRPGSAARDLGRAVGAVSLFAAPALTVLTVTAPYLAGLLFHAPGAGAWAAPLAIGTLLCCYQSVLGSALNGLGRPGAAAAAAIAADAVQLGLTYFTVGRCGLGGYAAGFAASSLVGALLCLRTLRRRAGLHLDVLPQLVCPLLACTLAALCMRPFLLWCLDGGMAQGPACALACGLGLVVYLAALQAQGLFRPGRHAGLREFFR